jgi:hypothetical protein
VYTHPFTGSVRLQPGYLNQVTQVAVGSNGLLPLLHYLATVVDAFSQRLLGLVVEGYFFWIIFAVEAIRVDLHLVFLIIKTDLKSLFQDEDWLWLMVYNTW